MLHNLKQAINIKKYTKKSSNLNRNFNNKTTNLFKKNKNKHFIKNYFFHKNNSPKIYTFNTILRYIKNDNLDEKNSAFWNAFWVSFFVF